MKRRTTNPESKCAVRGCRRKVRFAYQSHLVINFEPRTIVDVKFRLCGLHSEQHDALHGEPPL